jgi:DNA helicase II / ATP-dependent DNA helicase PcrA
MKTLFAQRIAELNREQKEAVSTIEGPVLVVAGPGTGKTQILVLRIANILEMTDSQAKSILALTFTENAATNMRERLLPVIGTLAHDVTLSTFHGFCEQVRYRYGEYFQKQKTMRMIDDIEKITLVQKIIKGEGFHILRPFGNMDMYINDILSNISHIKREHVSEEILLQNIQKEAEIALQNPDNFYKRDTKNAKKGDMKTGVKEKVEKKKEKLMQFSKVYKIYQEALLKNGWYDYDDMILHVIEACKTYPDLLFSLREQFLYVLVDEFQDTNSAQMELIFLILGDDKSANIFAVGDDDQSIYRFQGASLENMLLFKQHFPDAQMIQLQINYRSTQNILDIAQKSISNNTERLIHDKSLKADNDSTDISTCYEVYTSEESENRAIFEKIKILQDTYKTYDDIALLVRTNTDGKEMMKLAKTFGVPASFVGKIDIFETLPMRWCKVLLEYISSNNVAFLFSTLSLPIWKHDPLLLWEIFRKSYTSRKDVITFILENAEQDMYWQNIASTVQLLVQWQQDMHLLTLGDLFQKILKESGLLKYFTEHENILHLHTLKTLFEEIGRYTQNHPEGSLRDFLHTLEIRSSFGKPLTSHLDGKQENAVQILTIHSAKGMEFRDVFIPHIRYGNIGDRRERNMLKLPVLLHTQNASLNIHDEERRLFYVGLTRAKKGLHLTSAKEKNGRSIRASRFLDEISESITPKEKIDTEGEVKKTLAAYLNYEEEIFSKEQKIFIEDIISKKNFALSATHFETYRICPRKFLYQSLLRVPQQKSIFLTLGICVHNALEIFFNTYKETGIIPEKQILIEAFQKNMEYHTLSKDDTLYVSQEGDHILEEYYNAYHVQFTLPLQNEMDFRTHKVFVDHVPLTGKIDKIEMEDPSTKTIKVIDYKTSRPKSFAAIKGDDISAHSNIFAGNYYRQMMFYKILCDQSQYVSHNVKYFEIDFLKPDSSGKHKKVCFEIPSEDIENFKQELKETWDAIQKQEFPKTEEKEHICQSIGPNKGRCEFYDICWKQE